MARNIEIKAKLPGLEPFRTRAAALTSSAPDILIQRDTFYEIPSGRLKLREIEGASAELIFYRRADSAGPKLSDYVRSRLADPQSMHRLLAGFLPVRRAVEKRRELFLAGRTRIHLDEVAGLGWFLELETVLADEESLSDGEAVVADLMGKLGISESCLVEDAYVDLLERQDAGRDRPAPEPR